MIDPKLLRTDLPGVVRNLARRGFVLDEARITALEEQRKRAQIDADRVRAERNTNAKAVGQAKGKGEDATQLLARAEALTHELGQVDASLTHVQTELDALQLNLPNLLHESVPEGRDEAANHEVHRWGEPRRFDFKPLDHV
ncbi:MAG TPA: serine--tRNA ligase, partial [Rhodanobacter sp.]